MTPLSSPVPTTRTMYAVEIDFDEASKAWMGNKIRNGPCMAYRCAVVTKKGQQCSKKAVPRPLADVHMCSNHLRYGKSVYLKAIQ